MKETLFVLGDCRNGKRRHTLELASGKQINDIKKTKSFQREFL